jgi:hypothetical protein
MSSILCINRRDSGIQILCGRHNVRTHTRQFIPRLQQ